MQQIFRNVLFNAVKFTPQMGRSPSRSRKMAIAPWFRCAIRGEGITPEFLPFVFEMFRQQERAGAAGTGTRHRPRAGQAAHGGAREGR